MLSLNDTTLLSASASSSSASSRHAGLLIPEQVPRQETRVFCLQDFTTYRIMKKKKRLISAYPLSAASQARRRFSHLVCSGVDNAEVEKEEWDKAREKLNAFLQDKDGNAAEIDPAQGLHEAARKFQLLVQDWGGSSLTKGSWFPTALLGVDQNSWIKPFAYQAAAHAYLRAVLEIAGCGQGQRDRDMHVLVQQSICRLCAPLEDSIKEQLLARDPAAEEWFWSKQHPIAVSGFVEMLKNDLRFTTATSLGWEGTSSIPSEASDVTLLTLAISATAVLLKLGPLKLSCSSFSSSLTEEIGKLMDSLAEVVPISQVYKIAVGAGLSQEFLHHFGPRALNWRNVNDRGGEESAFWVDLIQTIIRRAIQREQLWSKLTNYDSIEVLEKDLSVLGFFAFLGRKSRSFLASKNAEDTHQSLSTLLKYFTGGSVLFYPQLASLTTYQLFIEIVCEEMSWLPLYPVAPSMEAPVAGEGNGKSVLVPMSVKREAISAALDNCVRWVEDFMKFSTWAQPTSGYRAGRFLAICSQLPRQNKLNFGYNMSFQSNGKPDADDIACKDVSDLSMLERDGMLESQAFQKTEEKPNLFDKGGASIEVVQSLQEAKVLSEIQRLEILSSEVVDLERRIFQFVGKSSKEHETLCEDLIEGSEEAVSKELMDANVLKKSIEKLKDATTDACRGTKLLATDVAAATVLLKRAAAGERITDREKKILRRTLTDLASVIPIGFLMLLPVTAVGHAAILAAIQRYAPSLIPSAYAPARLELLKQLEEISEIEKDERKRITLS